MSDYDEQSDEQLQNPAEDTMKCVELNLSNVVNRSKKSSLQSSHSESSLLKTPRETLEEKLEKLKIDYNKAGKVCKRMEKLIVKLKKDIEAKNSIVKKLLSGKKDLQSKLNRSIRNCDAFEERLEDKEEENRRLIAEIAHLTREKIAEIENLEDNLKWCEEQYELSFIARNRLGVENPQFFKMSHDEVISNLLDTISDMRDLSDMVEEDKKKMLQELNEAKKRLESKVREVTELEAKNAHLEERSKLLEEMRKRLRAGIPAFERMTTNEIISHILENPTHEQSTGLEDLDVEHFIKSLEISSEEKKQKFRNYIKQVYQKRYVCANMELIMEQSLGNQERHENERNRNEPEGDVEETPGATVYQGDKITIKEEESGEKNQFSLLGAPERRPEKGSGSGFLDPDFWIRSPGPDSRFLHSGHRIPGSRFRIPDCWVQIPDSGLLGPDSGFRIPDSWVRIPDSGRGFRIPDSGRGFRIPDSGRGFPDSGFRILDSGFLDAGSRIPDFRIPGSGFLDPGFRIPGLGFRIRDSGFRSRDSGYRIRDSGFRIPESRIPDSGPRFPDPGFQIPYRGSRVQDSGPGFPDPGFRVPDLGFPNSVFAF